MGFLAIVLVVVSAVLMGVAVWLIWAVPLELAIALGAVVAPPDAVAATSLGKRLALPPRIVTILEGDERLASPAFGAQTSGAVGP